MNKSLTPFQHDIEIGTKPESHTYDIAAELIDRLKFNTGYEITPASQKVIKYGVEQFTINRHPYQIVYCIKALMHSQYWNVAINAMIIHLRWLLCWRYFYKLVGKHRHHFSDLINLMFAGNFDVSDVFNDFGKVHSHKDFIAFMWKIRTTLDFDEMLNLNNCVRYWKKYHESHSDKICDDAFKRFNERSAK